MFRMTVWATVEHKKALNSYNNYDFLQYKSKIIIRHLVVCQNGLYDYIYGKAKISGYCIFLTESILINVSLFVLYL